VSIAVVAFSAAACGEETGRADPADADPAASTSADPSDSRPGRPAKPTGENHADDLPAPPAVRVSYGDEHVDLRAWTYCFISLCADGIPPAKPPNVGSPDQVTVEFPLEGWTFKASFQPAGQPCARYFPAKLDEIEPGVFMLRPAGYDGKYDVILTGRGPEGDAFVTFRWRTPSDGPLPSPSSYVGIIAPHDHGPGSYGVEMQASQLAETPDRIDSTITVTAANGESMTFSPRLTRSRCEAEGWLYWDGPTAKGEEAAALGPAPFAYDVELILDGRTYVAHATWPDDVIRGLSPYVRLNFSPDLPALS
jgi:hypothetical protein